MSNPLLQPSPGDWERLIEAVDPASLLIVIDRRMGSALRRSVTADDILQETLLHAWRDRASFVWQGLRSFRSWLLTIIDHRISHAAQRQAATKRQGEARAVPMDGDDSAAMPSAADFPAGSTTPGRLAMYREHAEMMKTALEELPEEFREIVRLRYFEQRTLDDIAEQLGLGKAAVRHRFRKGSEIYVRRLRTALRSSSGGVPPESASVPAAGSSPPLR